MNPFLILSAIGGANSAIGSFFGAKSQRDQLRFQSRMDAINAGVASLQAKDAMRQGERQQQAIKARGNQVKSSQRVALAANGIDLGSNLAESLQDSTDAITEMDATTTAANAIRTAWGYRSEATNLANRANTASATASSISPTAATATSLLGSATSVASRWKF